MSALLLALAVGCIEGIIVSRIQSRVYLTSIAAKYCYRTGEKTLKNPLYFQTIEDCGKPLK